MIYAWARRKKRNEFDDIFNQPWVDLQGSHQGALMAWINITNSLNPETLLEWWELTAKSGTFIRDDWFYTPLLIEEYAKKLENKSERRSKLLDVVLSKADRFNLHNPIHNICLELIIRDIASEVPEIKVEMPETDKGWFTFLYSHLAQLGFPDIATICKGACIPNQGYGHILSFAKLLWIYSNYKHSLDDLLDDICTIEEISPYESLRLLSLLAPKNKIEAWETVIEYPDRGLYPMVAFCKWLKPSYRDSLSPYFGHYDNETAACAYQAYLHKTPKSVANSLWGKNYQHRPMWQDIILDRLLFAPKAIKPPAVVEDVQAVEYDMRLYDPLNIRRF